MAEERDRTKRYANPPKDGKKGGMQNKDEGKAKAKVETAERKEGEHKGPTDEHPGKVGEVGKDKGPHGSPSPEFGVVAERHKSEHAAMTKRHGEEMAAHHEHHTKVMADTHERHGKEAKEMMARHHEELQDHMEGGAERKAEATAGKPKELGEAKDEGKKGSNV